MGSWARELQGSVQGAPPGGRETSRSLTGGTSPPTESLTPGPTSSSSDKNVTSEYRTQGAAVIGYADSSLMRAYSSQRGGRQGLQAAGLFSVHRGRAKTDVDAQVPSKSQSDLCSQQNPLPVSESLSKG